MNQTIPKGHTASFSCTAVGDPRPSITWYKSHDLITSNARYHILANQTLVIYSVTAQDSGSLTCRAMNEAGTREAKAYLLVAGLHLFSCTLSFSFPISKKFNALWFHSYCNNRKKWPHYIMSAVLHPPPLSQRQKKLLKCHPLFSYRFSSFHNVAKQCISGRGTHCYSYVPC